MKTIAPLSDFGFKVANTSDEAFDVFNYLNTNRFEKDTNPNGVVNIGVAINKLLQKTVVDKLNAAKEFDFESLEYGSPRGSDAFRNEIASLVNRHFNVHTPITDDDIVVTNGCTAAINVISWIICNPGDAVLVSAPLYGAFLSDVTHRTGATLEHVQVPVSELQSTSQIALFEQKFAELSSKGIVPKMLIICNPHNPTGKIYPRKVLESFYQFAESHNMYVLVDEIYALSVYRAPHLNDTPEPAFVCSDSTSSESTSDLEQLVEFESALSWPNLSDFINPQRVVVVHGMSKDFCMNGLRVGWIISPWNKDIKEAAFRTSNFQYISSHTDSVLTNFLSDHEFIDNFISQVCNRLKESYIKISDYFKKNGIGYYPAQAGHFIWADFSPLLLKYTNKKLIAASKSENGNVNGTSNGTENQNNVTLLTSTSQLSVDDCKSMWRDAVYKAGVCYTAGANFLADRPGWVRVIFAIPWDELELGLDRLIKFSSPDQ
ncbi:hypothetical protein BB560_002582 [Smittium megazygosporum]|uniref:Aminotransferase class I/classII large domain-containing protein n=1 Tax=Smittium megazygosporum TaxID=133381 RepID=A0A2T9ZEF6_9FUNG|nr:hypothetical protein BB560_002582 [Smittium megazygosporum]